MGCPACLASGLVLERIPIEDATADAATLWRVLPALPKRPRIGLLTWAYQRGHHAFLFATTPPQDEVWASTYGRAAANAAFRLCPGLRESAA